MDKIGDNLRGSTQIMGKFYHSLSIFFDIYQNILLWNIIYSKKMTATKILTHNEDSKLNS
ncbi:conserved hypothetical protein [Vibrio chagasii]|nr:conserved hypothetical protein [Vibrio chagasii]CAH7228122.1 conserved hypothetical protein [Vibrio chagasii]CAH7233870.1 conserved hypothetical protein [Vibrio chagasii]